MKSDGRKARKWHRMDEAERKQWRKQDRRKEGERPKLWGSEVFRRVDICHRACLALTAYWDPRTLSLSLFVCVCVCADSLFSSLTITSVSLLIAEWAPCRLHRLHCDYHSALVQTHRNTFTWMQTLIVQNTNTHHYTRRYHYKSILYT